MARVDDRDSEAGRQAMTARPESGAPPPYVGLRPFEFDEAPLFYGRGEHIAEMVRTLRERHFVAVVGSSGSGKSSLVRAGLLPAIAAGFMNRDDDAADWRFVIMRPGDDPYGNLLRELLPQLAPGQSLDPATVEFRRQTLRGGPRGLVETVADSLLPEHVRLVVLVDQFEEIFRFLEPGGPGRPDDGSSLADRRNDAIAFVDMLLATAEERDPHVYVVLTMRSEELGKCEAFLGLSAAIAKSQFLTPRMTREQIKDIIERPIQALGGRIEPQVVTDLLNSLGTAEDQLPRVEHLLLQMWNRARENRKDQVVSLTLEDDRATGRLESALDRHAEQLYSKLGPGTKPGEPSEKQRVAQHLFLSLAVRSPQGTLGRRLSTVGEVASVAGASEEIVKEVVEHFGQPGCNFLVATPSAPLTGKTTLDISHEALLRGWARLRTWLDEEAKSAADYCRLEADARSWQKGEKSVLHSPELDITLKQYREEKWTPGWARRYGTDFDLAIQYLKESQATRDAEAAEQRHQRNVRRLLLYTIIAVLAVACIGFGRLWSLARKARDEAVEQQKKAEAATDEATKQQRAARTANLRVRKQNMDDKSTIASMAGRLAELTTPEEAAIWQRVGASALTDLRKHKEAIEAYESLLEIDPNNTQARFNLGYLYILVHQPEEALTHTKFALERDPTQWNAYQNRAIALGMLGMSELYDQAAEALRESMARFQHRIIDSEDTEIAPEIQRATGRTMLVLDERALNATSLLALANLEAFRGGDGFEHSLQGATAQAPPTETYLAAVNWAWYHLEARPQDYGGFAAQGEWWEKAGFKPFAKQAYEKFQSEHQKRADARYTKLAVWVSGRLKALKDEKLPEEDFDTQTLAIDAWDYENRNAFDKAQRCLDEMIKNEPDNPGVFLRRACFSARRAWASKADGDAARAKEFFTASKRDCYDVLKKDPKSSVACTNVALM